MQNGLENLQPRPAANHVQRPASRAPSAPAGTEFVQFAVFGTGRKNYQI